MPQFIKSVLFFDYDSVYRSLREKSASAAEAFGQRAGDWLAAIEKGGIVSPAAEDMRRRILVRRCYGDPKMLGDNRARLIASGIQVIDCPPIAGRERSSADIHIALDANDALEHTTGFEEFILLSGDSDLTPILFKLRAHNRNSVIYATTSTSDSYRSFADAAVEESALLELLGAGAKPTARAAPSAPAEKAEVAPPPVPAPATRTEVDTARPYDKEELASLVRRIHHATRVPLFSPRVFADLFRRLASEIAENGYRFQTTAENVADRMVEAGRNVTRRQVGFVVKGLALKGHMFSPQDTPEGLADVFREQVLYLARSAGIELSERDKGMVSAWIIGRGGSVAPPAASVDPVKTAELPPAAMLTTPPPPPKPEREPEPAPDTTLRFTPIPETPVIRRPPPRPAKAKPEAAASPVRERPAVITPPPPPKVEPVAEEEPAKPQVLPLKRGASAQPERPARAAQRRAAAPEPVKEVQKEAPKVAESKPAAPPADDMENSILAAIAEAVDVLVEDRATDNARTPVDNARPPQAKGTAPITPVESDDDSDDIGEEIQRILASYSQNRDKRK